MAIEKDSVVGLIGSNGAGKTTFINMVTGYLKPTSGAIIFEGRDITPLSPRLITRLGICRSFQIPQLFASLSVYENLMTGVGIVFSGGRWSDSTPLEGTPEQAVDAMLERVRSDRLSATRMANVLPEGIRKLLDIAMAMAVKPKILLLDEPTSGVSADEKFG